MTDHVDERTRSRIMAAVRSKDTGPELAVRRIVHRLGYRFRLHPADLPGKPDIVLPRHGKVLFVHGCFWHRHRGCRYATTPQTRVDFWQEKFLANVRRDRRNRARLKRLGWSVLTVWQCELKKPEKLVKRLEDFLSA